MQFALKCGVFIAAFTVLRHAIKPPPRVTGAAVGVLAALLCTVATAVLVGSRASDPDSASSSDLQTTEDIGVLMKDLRAVVCALSLALTVLHLARHRLLRGEHSVAVRFARDDWRGSWYKTQEGELGRPLGPRGGRFGRRNLVDEARAAVAERPIDMRDMMLCGLFICAATGLLLVAVVVPVLLTLGRPAGAWIAAGCSMLGCVLANILYDAGRELRDDRGYFVANASRYGVHHAEGHVGWLRAGRCGCKSKPWTIHVQNPKDGARFYYKNAVTGQSSRQLGQDENGAVWMTDAFDFDEWVDAGMHDGRYTSQSPWTRVFCGTQCYYRKAGQTTGTLQAPHEGIRGEKLDRTRNALVSAQLLDDLKSFGHYDESSEWIQHSYNKRSYYRSDSRLATLRQPDTVRDVVVYDDEEESRFERGWREAERYDAGELSLDSKWQEVQAKAKDDDRAYFEMVGEGDRQRIRAVLTLQRPAEGARPPVHSFRTDTWLEAEQQDLLRSAGRFNPHSIWEEVACRDAVCYSTRLQLFGRRDLLMRTRKVPATGAYTRRQAEHEQLERILKDAEEFDQQPGSSVDSNWVRVSDGERCYFEFCRPADESPPAPELTTQEPPEGVLCTHEERRDETSSDEEGTPSDRASKKREKRERARARERKIQGAEPGPQRSAHFLSAEYNVGDKCQVFSKSAGQWLNGRVVRIDQRAGTVETEYTDRTTGKTRQKVLLLDSEDLRQRRDGAALLFAERFAHAERQDALRRAGEYDRDSTMVWCGCDDDERAYYKDTATGRLSLQRPPRLRDVILDLPGPRFEQRLARAQKYDDGILNVDSEWVKVSCDGRTYYAKGQKRGSAGGSLMAPSEGVRDEAEDFGARFDDGYSRAEKLDAGELTAASTWVKWTSGRRTLYANTVLTLAVGTEVVWPRPSGRWERGAIAECRVNDTRDWRGTRVAAIECRSDSDLNNKRHIRVETNSGDRMGCDVERYDYGRRNWFGLSEKFVTDGQFVSDGQFSFVRPPEGITDEIHGDNLDDDDQRTFDRAWKSTMTLRGGGGGSE